MPATEPQAAAKTPKRPSVKLNFTVSKTDDSAYLKLPAAAGPMAMMGGGAQPGSVEFDGITVTFTIGKESKTWRTSDEAFVDVLRGCTLEKDGLTTAENLDKTTSEDFLRDIAAFEKPVIHQGRLLILPSTANYRIRGIQYVTPSRVTVADDQERLKAGIADWRDYETKKATLLETPVVDSLQKALHEIMTPRLADEALRGMTQLARTRAAGGTVLEKLANHLTTDDTATLTHGGTDRTLASIITPASTTANSITADLFAKLHTFLEHTEIPGAVSGAIFPEEMRAPDNLGDITARFKNINHTIKAGVADRYIISPLQEKLVEALGDSADTINLSRLRHAIADAEDAATAQTAAAPIIASGKALRQLLDQYKAAKDNKDIDAIRAFTQKFQDFVAVPDRQAPFQIIGNALKNQIELDIATLIVNDDTTNKKLVERLKPILEREQHTHEVTLANNNPEDIAALAETTRAAIGNDAELYHIQAQFDKLKTDLDEIEKDPKLKQRAEAIRTRAFGDGEKDKGAQAHIEKAVEDGNLAAAREAADTMVADVDAIKMREATLPTINALQEQFTDRMYLWLTQNQDTPSAIKACWTRLEVQFNADREHVLELLASNSASQADIDTVLGTMLEKIPGQASKLHAGRTAATQWLATLTTAATSWQNSTIEAVADNELLSAVYPAGDARPDPDADPLNPRGLAHINAETIDRIRAIHEAVGRDDDGLLAQANTIVASLNELTDNVGRDTFDVSAVDAAIVALRDTAQDHLTAMTDANPRGTILAYNLNQFGDPDAFAGTLPAEIADHAHALYQSIAIISQQDFAGATDDSIANHDNAHFIRACKKLKALRLMFRAGVLLKKIKDFYPDNNALTTLHQNELQAILSAVKSGDYDFIHLKNNLDLLTNRVYCNVVAFSAPPESDDPIKQYNSLIKMLDMLDVSTAVRNQIQGLLPAGTPALFKADGATRTDEEIKQDIGFTGFASEYRQFAKALQTVIDGVKEGNNLRTLGAGLAQPLPSFNTQANWVVYQSLLQLVNHLDLSAEKRLEIQNKANEGLAGEPEHYLAENPDAGAENREIGYANRADLNQEALKNALGIVSKIYHAKQAENLAVTDANMKQLKFVADYSLDLVQDLQRIASGTLSTFEADTLDNIIAQTANQLHIISTAIDLAQREKAVASTVNYKGRSVEDQQKRIKALTKLEKKLLDTQHVIQSKLNVIIADKVKLKTSGKPMIAPTSLFEGGGTYKTTSRGQQIVFDAKKAMTCRLPTLNGEHTAVRKFENPEEISFTVTTHDGKSAICVPNKLLSADGSRAAAQSVEANISNHVDAVNRGLPVLESSASTPICIQSSDIRQLFIQYYTLQHCSGKSNADITARYTGSARSLSTLTRDWNLEELEAKTIEVIAREAPKHKAGFFNSSREAWAHKQVAQYKTKIRETHSAMKTVLTTTTGMDCAEQAQRLHDANSNQANGIGTRPALSVRG